MFIASRPAAGVSDEGSADSHPTQPQLVRHAYVLIATAPQEAIAVIRRELEKVVGGRSAAPLTSRLHQTLDGSREVHAELFFEADQSERRAVSEVIRLLCKREDVKYLRLDTR